MHEIQKEVLKRLKKATEMHGSLKKLSEETGISPSYISRIRSEKIKMSLGMMNFWKIYFKI